MVKESETKMSWFQRPGILYGQGENKNDNNLEFTRK